MMKNQDPQHDVTQTPRRTGFGVAASPFNTVKLELGFVIIFGVVLWLAIDFITASYGIQLALLAGYSLISAIWLILRTRRILQQQDSTHN